MEWEKVGDRESQWEEVLVPEDGSVITGPTLNLLATSCYQRLHFKGRLWSLISGE